nr:S-layer homology domain-containing protein [Paenibacillus sp. MMS18-CY102]
MLFAPATTTAGSPVHAAAHDVQQATAGRTKQQIVGQWLQDRPMATGRSYMPSTSIYAEQPKLTAPYDAGKLKPAYIEDGINAANFVRYLAGLPNDLTADWTLEQQQQTAALVNAVNNQLTHYPSKPADMEQAIFELGQAGTSSSNLFKGSPTFYDNVLGYMSDSDPSNIGRVGHRRWILNPAMKKTMFGMVYASGSADYSPPYASMYAFNRDRDNSEFSYDYIAWPSAGYFPEEVFAPADAWSVSLNPSRYDKAKTSSIRVQLTRERDGKSWTLDQADRNANGEFFNVETSGFGVPFAVIFRPDGIGKFGSDDTFRVHISGVYTLGGQEASIDYKTTFFNLLPDPITRYAIQLRKGETLQLGMRTGAQQTGNTFLSGNAGVAAVDSKGNIRAVGKGDTWVSVDEYLGSVSTVNIRVVDADPADRVSKWAVEDYTLAKSNGLISRTYDHSYQKAITRYDFTGLAVQMAETIMDNNLYSDDVAYGKSPFRDVDDWRVTWANRNGIIKGTSPNVFSPYETITREQAATLLMNLYNRLSQLTGQSDGEAAAGGAGKAQLFEDDKRIAPWAKDNVYKAVALSLMDGTGYNQFKPKGVLTYEQTFVLLQKAFEVIGQ